jgi:hypothetical protein
MMKFKNPADGSEAVIPATARLWAILFGPVYFAAKGLWGVALIETVLSLAMLTDVRLVAVLWIGIGLSADYYLARRYRRRGWVAEGPALAKQKTSWVAWLLLILMIPVFAYFLANSIT